MIERERRFLVDQVPNELPPPNRIEQGYLSTKPATVRVRRHGAPTEYTLTLKTGSGLARTEIERSLSAAEFDALWAFTTKLRVEKRRYEISLDDGLIAELDLFEGDFVGRRVVEVEFDSDAQAEAFAPPAWFGREVTHDGRYSNASVARRGWPTDDRHEPSR